MSASVRSQDFEIEAIPENLFREPIDYLYADHFRQRVVCKFLDQIAFDPGAANVARLATLALEYLEQDLSHHIADEEQDLFPRLRTRCKPPDHIVSILTVLSEEHAKDAELSSGLLAGLRRLKEGRPLKQVSEFLQTAAAFAETQRRHIAWEEDVVLPLARKRLSANDLEEIGRGMAARRGLAFPT